MKRFSVLIHSVRMGRSWEKSFGKVRSGARPEVNVEYLFRTVEKIKRVEPEAWYCVRKRVVVL
jgi:hypothetical protein